MECEFGRVAEEVSVLDEVLLCCCMQFGNLQQQLVRDALKEGMVEKLALFYTADLVWENYTLIRKAVSRDSRIRLNNNTIQRVKVRAITTTTDCSTNFIGKTFTPRKSRAVKTTDQTGKQGKDKVLQDKPDKTDQEIKEG